MTTPPDVASWDTAAVTTMRDMFSRCTGMTNAPAFSMTNSTQLVTVDSMFYGIGTGVTGNVNDFWDTGAYPNITAYLNFSTGAVNLSNYADIPDAWKGIIGKN